MVVEVAGEAGAGEVGAVAAADVVAVVIGVVGEVAGSFLGPEEVRTSGAEGAEGEPSCTAEAELLPCQPC